MNDQNNINPTTPTPEVPVTPIQPVTPEQPVVPVQPIVPEQPPVQPIVQEQPPVVPQTPVVEPIQPVQPIQPVEPIQPIAPVAPVVSEQPVQEVVQPVQPVTPVAPEQPVQPVAEQPQVIAPTEQVQQPVVNAIDNSSINATVQNGGIQNPGTIAPSVPINGPIDSTNIGFVQTGTDLKKKTNPLIIVGIVVVIIAILGAVGYFVVYPKLLEKANNPQTIFKTALTEMSKQAGSTVTEMVHTKNIYELKATIDSDYEPFEQFSGYTYMGRIGVDPENKNAELGYGVIDNSTKADYSNYYYIKSNKLYTKFSNDIYRNLIYLGSAEDSEINNYIEMLNDYLTKLDPSVADDSNYVVTSLFNAFSVSLDPNQFRSEDASITVAGNSVKVKKNIYTINKSVAEGMTDKIVTYLSDDDKFIESVYNIAILYDEKITKDEIKETIKSIKGADMGFSSDLNIDLIIYTTGTKAQFVGMEMVTKEVSIHYYTLNNNFEIVLSADKEDVVSIIGVANDSVTNVSIKYMGTEYATLKIKKNTDTELEFDYVLNIPMSIIDSEEDYNSDEKYVLTGTFAYKKTINNENSLRELNVKVVFPERTYISVNLSLLNDWTSEVANIKTSTAETLSDSELETVLSNFIGYLNKTPVSSILSTLDGYGDYNVPYYNSNNSGYNYDNYGDENYSIESNYNDEYNYNYDYSEN